MYGACVFLAIGSAERLDKALCLVVELPSAPAVVCVGVGRQGIVVAVVHLAQLPPLGKHFPEVVVVQIVSAGVGVLAYADCHVASESVCVQFPAAGSGEGAPQRRAVGLELGVPRVESGVGSPHGDGEFQRVQIVPSAAAGTGIDSQTRVPFQQIFPEFQITLNVEIFGYALSVRLVVVLP